MDDLRYKLQILSNERLLSSMDRVHASLCTLALGLQTIYFVDVVAG